jgi:hypothetical protein
VCAGIDVASTRALNVIEEVCPEPNEGRRVVIGEAEDRPDSTSFEQLCALMNLSGVTLVCIDRAPERRFSEAFARTFPGRLWLCGYYTPAPAARGDVLPGTIDEDARPVTLWRTLAIDAALEPFRLQRLLLPPLEQFPAEYPAHLGNVVGHNVELAGGQVRPEYRSIGPNDYLQRPSLAGFRRR